MKILLADDDPKVRLIVKLWLERNGHEVSLACDGAEALTMLEAEHFDGLITDVNMPLLAGIDLVKRTLQLPEQPDIIVVLTSRCDLEDLREAEKSAKVHFFNKPFSPMALAALIQDLACPETAE